jgi:hypothetical protein
VATRLYLQATGAAAVTAPALPTGWTAGLTAAVQRKAVTAKANTALTDFTVAETTASITNIPVGIFISDPLTGGSISGTLTAVVRGLESATSADDSLQVGVYLITGTGSAVQSTLYAGHTAALGTTSGALGQEFGTSAATRIIPSTAHTTQTAAAGDRLMVIVGYRTHDAATTNRSSTLRFGDPTATSDFALTAGLTTDLVPWVELSTTLTFSNPLTQTLPAEALGLTDSGQSVTRSITVTDSLITQDTWTSVKSGTAISRTQTDNLGITDSGQSQVRGQTVTDVTFITDSLIVETSSSGILTRSITDNLGLDDTPAEELRSYDEDLTENLGLTDTVTLAVTAVTLGSITLGGTPAGRGAAGATGAVTLGGTPAGRGAAVTTGSITLGGITGAEQGGSVSTGSITLSGTAGPFVVGVVAGSITLTGAGTGLVIPQPLGVITLGGDITALTQLVALGGITLSGTVAADPYEPPPPVTPVYLFRPPVRMLQGPRTVVGPHPGNPLMRHYARPGPAVCVIIDGTTVRERQVPTTDELLAATYHYLGGHEYLITAAEAELLTQAGYDVPGYESPVYGLGVYGTGPYGL